MRALFSDVSIVYLHLLLPEDQKSGLPFTSGPLERFADSPALVSPAEERQIPAHVWKALQDSLLAQLDLRLDRPQIFRNFLHAIRPTHQPTLHYLHMLLPHVPYEYLRSGQTYSVDGGHPGITKEIWSGDVVGHYPELSALFAASRVR